MTKQDTELENNRTKTEDYITNQNFNQRDPIIQEQLKLERLAKLKWNLAVLCMALRFLLDGMEYAIVIPTLYGFLTKLGINVKFLGVIGASYAIGGFIAAPIFGKISDQVGSGKSVISFGCILSICGNIIYFFARNKWYLVSARFLCGLSSGVEPVILGEIGKNEQVKPTKRASLFSMLFTIRQVGILLGPAAVLIFRKVNIKVTEHFTIDVSNFGALFCTVLFFICLLMFIFFFNVHDITPPDSEFDRQSVPDVIEQDYDDLESTTTEPLNELSKGVKFSTDIPRKKFQHTRAQSFCEEIKSIKESTFRNASQVSLDKVDKITVNFLSKKPVKTDSTPDVKNVLQNVQNIVEETRLVAQKSLKRFGSQMTLVTQGSHITADFMKYAAAAKSFKAGGMRDLLCEPVLIGLFGTYAIYIQQSTVETIMAPTTDMLLGWKEEENAYLLLGVGIEAVLGFLSISLLSKKLNDRGILFMGTTAISLITFGICCYSPYAEPDLWWLTPTCKYWLTIKKTLFQLFFLVLLSTALFVFFMPYIVTGTAAVLSRAVPPHRQATVQGLRTACERCGQILGPLLAAQALNWNLFWVFFPPGKCQMFNHLRKCLIQFF